GNERRNHPATAPPGPPGPVPAQHGFFTSTGETKMSKVEFRVLGPLECWADGRQLRLGGIKPQIVLSTLLLAEGSPGSLTPLGDAVWDQIAPPTATKQVRNAVSDLRQVLTRAGAAITPVGDGYRLDPGRGVLDANAFVRRTARAQAFLQARRFGSAI